MPEQPSFLALGMDIGSSYVRAAALDAHQNVHVLMDDRRELSALIPSALAGTGGQLQAGWDAQGDILWNAVPRWVHSSEAGSEGLRRQNQLFEKEKVLEPLLSALLSQIKPALLKHLKELPASVAAVVNNPEDPVWKKVLEQAGFKEVKLVTQSEALTQAFRLKKDTPAILCDFGGGFSRVILTGPQQIVRSAAVGGEDLDWRIALKIESVLREEWGEPLSLDFFLKQILPEAKKLKMAVSHRGSVDVRFQSTDGKKKFSLAVSRYEAVEWTKDLLENMVKPLKDILKDSGLKQEDMDDVYLSGGSSRLPAIQERVAVLTSKKPKSPINVDTAVVTGCALLAAQEGTS